MKAKIHTRNVKQRQCYEIVGGNLYRTIDAAAKAEAWHIILGRYVYPGERLDRIVNLRGMTCDCGETDNGYAAYWDTSQCEIHSRYDGYFARLHRRLWPLIVAKWQAEEQEIRRQ